MARVSRYQRSAADLEARLAAVESALQTTTNPLRRLELHQERIDLTNLLRVARMES